MKRSFQVTELSKGLGRGRVRCIAWQQQSITASRVRDFILQVDVWIHWWFLLGRLLFLADEIWSACCDSRAFIFSCFVPVITTTSLWYRLFTFSVIPQPLHLSLSGQADLWVTVHASYSLTVMIASEIRTAYCLTEIKLPIITAIRTCDWWRGLKWTE